LEMTTFLAGYLLCSQGDRILMGHSVEGRFPFLDHELAELAASIPASIKLESLNEKSILKKSVEDLLPPDVLQRPKQPYRAPDSASFLGRAGSQLATRLLSREALRDSGFWQADRVGALARKWQARRLISARDNMALVGILSAQLLWRQFGPELAGRIQAAALLPGQLVWRRHPAGSATERRSGPGGGGAI
jgi:asparagine synthase (glutamine-hydrolysing)